MRRRVLLVVPVLFAVLLAPIQAWATTYYVSKSGSDVNSCVDAQSTTQTLQKLTVAAGIGCLATGDILQIHTGTYAETIALNTTLANLSGTTWANATRIEAFSGETVTLTGIGGCTTNSTTTRYIIFNDLNFNTSSGSVAGFSACGGTGVQNHFRFDGGAWTNNHASTSCVQNGGDDDITGHANEFLNLVISGCGDEPPYTGQERPGYAIYNQADDVIVRDTEMSDITGYCVHNYQATNLPSNNLYERLFLHQCATATAATPAENSTLGFAVLLNSGTGNILRYSLLINNGNGIDSGGASSKIYNNVVYNSGNASPSIPCGTQCYNAIVATGASTEVKNNIVFSNNLNAITNSGSGAVSSNNITTDPSWTNGSGLFNTPTDFQLQASSNARNAGTNLSLTTDYAQATVPIGAAPDCGIYEYQGADQPVITYIGSVKAGSVGGGDVTTAAVDFSTCTSCAIVCAVGDQQGVGSTSISSSPANTFTKLTVSENAGGPRATIFYALNATVSATQTFSTTTTGTSYPGIVCAAYKNVKTADAFDQQNGNAANVDPFPVGSVTPAEHNEVVVTMVAYANGETPTLSGYTIRQHQAFSGGNNYGCDLGDQIQTTATATNPTWDWAIAQSSAGRVATFKVATTTAIPRVIHHLQQGGGGED